MSVLNDQHSLLSTGKQHNGLSIYMQIENPDLANSHQQINFEDNYEPINPYGNTKASLLPKIKHLSLRDKKLSK